MIDVVALGELLIDFTCVSSDAEGYPTMAAHPGGAPANFLAALSKFGAKTALIGKVGNDTFGKLLVKTLENAGIETKGMILAEDVFTTLAFVTLDAQGDRSFAFARKPGADTCIRFEELDLTVRSFNCLRRVGYEKVADIIGLTEDEILGIKNLGRKNLDEIARKLLSVGVEESSWLCFIM